jgi:hypothetical protein
MEIFGITRAEFSRYLIENPFEIVNGSQNAPVARVQVTEVHNRRETF